MSTPEINRLIDDLLTTASIQTDRRLIAELIRDAIKLGSDSTSTLNLKIASAAISEMREAFAMFAPFSEQKKVTIFGSARTTKDDPVYKQTEAVAAKLAKSGWMVVTGAGPGIMEAGMSGAGREMSIGVSIRLPFETSANSIIAGDEKFVAMRYFFTRKLMLVKESQAFICMPGGFGTLDEMFELLTLAQTGKGNPVPIVVLDLPNDPFWEDLDAFIKQTLLPRKLVSPQDLALYRICSSVDDAVSEITNFYSVYHSMRFVGKRLVLRLNKQVSDQKLLELNSEFAEICVDSRIERIKTTKVEIDDSDNVDLPRLAFHFARRDFGRLRQLIDAINAQ
ncbi:MAG: TIGR00730 family Rossman fold protein [Actinomycetota bacterium]|nr:TIGR00730 family Rossman fold protein [Actinomycetota bacterium]MDA3003712.1 TIGR00730 family Rossman fold protein [Actinomycetota bacterium]